MTNTRDVGLKDRLRREVERGELARAALRRIEVLDRLSGSGQEYARAEPTGPQR